jgi:hypothetical protein
MVESCAAPKAALFLAESGGNRVVAGCERLLPEFDRPSVNVLLSKTLQNLTGQVIFP